MGVLGEIYFLGVRAPFVASGDTSPVNGGRRPRVMLNVIPPPFTGEVSAKLTEGALATQASPTFVV